MSQSRVRSPESRLKNTVIHVYLKNNIPIRFETTEAFSNRTASPDEKDNDKMNSDMGSIIPDPKTILVSSRKFATK